MRRAAIIVVLVCCATIAGAQAGPPFRDPGDASPRMAALRRAVASGSTTAIPAFWQELRSAGAPLVEPVRDSPTPGRSLVTFVWQGSAATQNVVVVDGVAVGVGGADPRNSRMTHLDGTDVWFRTYDVRNDARFIYRLSENDSMQSFVDPARTSASVIDPLNPRRYETGHSYLELPAAPRQPWIAPRDVPGGIIERTTFGDTTRFGSRPVWIYTPSGFERDTGTYPLLVVLDGSAYTSWVPTPTILDNLIAGKRIPPAVAVMVGSFARQPELSGSESFADMLAKELVPWMQARYRATRAASETIIAGSSLGGLAATFTAVRHPDVFGNVITQSGSFWFTPSHDPAPDWIAREITRLPRLPVSFFIEVGAMEVADQLDTNRRVRDALRAKGYAVRYREFNGNHTYLQWRGGIADGLVSLVGTRVR